MDKNTIQIGQETQFSIKITDALVRSFAELSGDKNPVHLDEAYASQTIFKHRIAHGMLTACFISRVLATDLPGPGSIYLGQTLKFTAPVYLDDEITIHLKITNIREAKGIATLETTARKSTGEIVLSGEATVLLPKV